ncbi:MAG: DUF3365 domain-containing protein [Thiolinea sp.]
MKLATKFNLILITTLLIGYMIAGYGSYYVLSKNAKQEVLDRANLLMESAQAVRKYTTEEIRPLLAVQNKRQFLPQTVAAYAATQTFVQMQKTNPEYSYKEATLNPTNLRDRAVDWENDIIQNFIKDEKEVLTVTERDTPNGRLLYIAKPIRINDPACLSCHSTPEAAPATMIEKYGSANGFGWKLKEVVGAQIISVPTTVPLKHAEQAFITFMGLLGGTFLFVIIVMNMLLRVLVIKPVVSMANTADKISKGEQDLAEFNEAGKSEIAVLGAAFNRMKRSLEQAMKMLE